MTSDDAIIKLSPYLGFSRNLIEFFAIIGYEEETIKQVILRFKQNQNSGLDTLSMIDQLELTFLSIVISDISFEFKSEIIIQKVYPEKPEIIYSRKPHKPDRIVFSSCIDGNNGEKKYYSCFAFRFHEKIITNDNEIYYIPKALLIYSQYPYFSSFYRICQKVLLSSNPEYADKDFPIDIYIHCLVNYFPSPINNNLILKDFNPYIIIPKLTGYPHVDFNLGKILNSLNLIEFIKIYILIFLETDLLFFSPELEKLNIFLFALYILNYPLTDSNYFWHIKSISLESLENKEDIETFTSYKGINCKYSEDIDLDDLKELNFVIDIENKKKIIVNIKETKEAKEINSLLRYVNGILNKSIFKNKSLFLKDYLLKLYDKLKIILNEYINITQKNKNFVDSFFYMDESIMNINRKIQEVFYDFVLNILLELSKDFIFDSSLKNPVVKKIIDNPKLSEEEKLFLKYSRKTIKYVSYFDNFISQFNAYDGIKVSLLFSDEYVNLKRKGMSEEMENKIKYFDIIDKLYISKKEDLKYDLKAIDAEYSQKNYVPNNSLFQKEVKLFTFDKDIIKKFIYKKRNKVYYEVLKEPDEIHIDKINKSGLSLTIQYDLSSKNIIEDEYYLRGTAMYIISNCFAFFPKEMLIQVLEVYIFEVQKIKYFQRYFIFILLKSINKFYNLNKEKGIFPEMNYESVQKYYEIIQNYLKDDSVIQDEEIFTFFKNHFNNLEEKIKDNKKNEEKKEKEFIFNFNDKNFEKISNQNFIINEYNITFIKGNDIFKFKKINRKAISELFQDIYILLDYFFDENFDLKNLEIIKISEAIVNLMMFFMEYKGEEKIINILFYLIQSLFTFLYQLDDFQKK